MFKSRLKDNYYIIFEKGEGASPTPLTRKV